MTKKKKSKVEHKDTVTSISLKESLGEEKFDELASREHKTQELPEKIKSKRNMSPNSLKNLAQYNKDISKESKKTMLENLRCNVDESRVQDVEELKTEQEDLEDAKSLRVFEKLEIKIGGDSIFLFDLIDRVFPTYQTLDKKEQITFNNISAAYLKDFENEELSYSDIDDVLSLALNKILELRLLKKAKKKPNLLSDTFISLEKLKKQNDKLKESLANTRKERKKHSLKSGVSILDLAASFDEERKEKLEKKEIELLKNEKEFIKHRISKGNEDDLDAK